MTIYEGSRYTNIPVYTNADTSDYIGSRLTGLHASCNAGDMMLMVHDSTGIFLGTKLAINDPANPETVIVQSVSAQPSYSQMWNSLAKSFMTMPMYTVNLQGMGVKYAHPVNTPIVISKSNMRPPTLPSLNFRNGVVAPDNNDTMITWRINDRLDIYALQYYGDASLWWAIMDANPQYQSIFDLQVGNTITIPSYDKVMRQIRGGS